MVTFNSNVPTPGVSPRISKNQKQGKAIPVQPALVRKISGKTTGTTPVLFTGPPQDSFELIRPKTPKPSRAETEAAQYVDNILEDCNKQPALERMTFRDFLVKAKLNPQRYLPTASSYVLDAFKHYDGPQGPNRVRVYGETLPQFSIMSAPWNRHLSDPVRLHGQESAVSRVWDILRTFKQQPNADRGIAFFGPHGTGKSVIPKTIMAGLEHFSKQDEGSLWTYSFVFPDGGKITPQPPEEAKAWLRDVVSEKHLMEPDKIAAQLMANLNLNPIFILPPKQRAQFLQGLKDEGKVGPDFNIDYYLKSNLDGHAQRVLDKLHHIYSNNPDHFQKTLNHVQVERWHMSAQDFRGLVEVPASHNPEAILRETQGREALAKAPELVRSMGQRSTDGLMPRAHRGVFYMDDFGRSGKSYDHLLMPLETGEVTIQEANGGPGIIKELLDFVPMLSINPEILEEARKAGNFDALEQRMLFVPVPCERRYKVESQILEPIINRAKARGKAITPHTLDAFSKWVTLTRLFPTNQQYPPYKELSKENKSFASAIEKLTPLGKAMLYQGEMPSNLTQEEFNALDENLKVIANEHTQSLGETEFSLYEGGVGLSNRAAMNMLKGITARPSKAPISFIDVFENIAQFANNKPQYEQKRSQILREKGRFVLFQSGLTLLREVEDQTRQSFMGELKDALNMSQPNASYVHRLQQYANHIQALRDGSMVTKQYQIDDDPKPNIKFVRDCEATMMPASSVENDRKNYRSMFLTRAIDWDSDLSEAENVQSIYQQEMDQLKAKDEALNKKVLIEFRDYVKVLVNSPQTVSSLKGINARRMTEAIAKMSKQGYPVETLPRILDWAFENRYIADQPKV